MKILKQGTIPPPKLRIFRGTCPECGCQIECNENEATGTADRWMSGEQLWTAKCPFNLLSYKCQGTILLQEAVLRTVTENLPPLQKTKNALADEFEKFFSEPSDGEGWWEKAPISPPVKRALDRRNELSKLADEL